MFARGNDRQPIFVDDLDRLTYLRLLGKVVRQRAWRCLAFCLMTNHVHLLVETPEPDLGAGMCVAHGVYARRFNARHRRTGHLFERRYGSVRIEDDAHLWMTLGYVERNPVQAGLVKHARDWPWSSYGLAAGGRATPWLDTPRLLEYLQALGGDPDRRYSECVEGRCAAEATAA